MEIQRNTEMCCEKYPFSSPLFVYQVRRTYELKLILRLFVIILYHIY